MDLLIKQLDQQLDQLLAQHRALKKNIQTLQAENQQLKQLLIKEQTKQATASDSIAVLIKQLRAMESHDQTHTKQAEHSEC